MCVVCEQGNRTSFVSSCPRASSERDSLQALFNLGAGKYDEMMGVLLSKMGLAGERPASVRKALATHPRDSLSLHA